ncbi:MAG: choice-of-anchor B family protein [Saprospiraceae bacterium]|nr:choice-of-anchor B family protein [Saprospiraceae bacterium]
MKKVYYTFVLCTFTLLLNAQLNTTLISHLPYDAELNDIWGWVAPDGTEYALVGAQNGVSIVSLANPQNPEEVAFVPGPFSRWRDLKTWGNFAYVTADESGTTEGLLVIDLSDLPNNVTYSNWKPTIDERTLTTCHNLYIDENGICYLAGCNINGGGVLFVDVATTPGTPAFIGKGPNIYAHDVYVRNNKMYASELYAGRLSIYDVSNKSNPSFLASQNTLFRFTHNAWLSDNEKVIFTTDERSNATVGAYDISNLSDIKELNQFKPAYTIGSGTIPHNVHVKDDYLLISYYTAGGVIVDAARPSNLVEVANWDTYAIPQVGFHGAWGLYPFLPSGNVLISDIENGLFVIKPNLKRACYLEGKITDALSNQAIFDASIRILSDQTNITNSDISGNYKTGQVQAGIFSVIIEKLGYQPKTVQATLQNGVVTILNAALTPLSTYSVTGKAVSSVSGSSVAGAKVIIANADYQFETTADNNGNFSLGSVYTGAYNITIGAWGYLHKVINNLNIDNNKSITIALDEGYQDDFIFDQGWQAQKDTATAGFWELGIPQGTFYNNTLASPNQDIESDIGISCYITGNVGGNAANSDVDNGKVRLVSPLMDLSDYDNPILSYYTWFFNDGGDNIPNDKLLVKISNGQRVVTLETISESLSGWRDQSKFVLSNFIELTENMSVIFETSDIPPDNHIVKAAVDAFLVKESSTTPTEEPVVQQLQIQTYPNPFHSELTASYHLDSKTKDAILLVYNAIGQIIERIPLAINEGNITIGNKWNSCAYLLRIQADGELSNTIKILKTN